ncbi:hypothetical protein TeGR_g4676 [Tetraparma gracilis]|uniref:bleomycin hydrolase n=1 Tax=Tetraparma gracilis TaxID=2962635 RepID=A0ABQ6MJY2_9STRA|nr:hypothetical protein TeGR_g4676 [Tetraparma gracilis]
MSLAPSHLSSYSAQLTPQHRLSSHALTRSDPVPVLLKASREPAHAPSFSLRLPREFDATSQRASGRCWIFACLNMLRRSMLGKLDLPASFQLSQSYVFFFDKLERCNYFLDSVIGTAASPLDSRLVQHLLSSPLNDGGQWEMLVNVIEKYGVVPLDAYPDTWSSTASLKMNRFLTSLLRSWAAKLREAIEGGRGEAELEGMKQGYLAEAYRVLVIHLGEPPSSVDFSFHAAKDKLFTRLPSMSPLDFYHTQVPTQTGAFVSLINDPRNPYFAAYTVEYLGNVVGGLPVYYINVPIELLKKYALRTLQAGESVWMGCDFGKHFNRSTQVMDTEQFAHDLVYGVEPEQSKEERLRYGQSLMTHAMQFVGADLPEGREFPTKWRIENSHGKELGDKGYALMTDEWFDEYMYQIAVRKDMVVEDERIKALLDDTSKVTVLPAWDPMGALAE